MTASEKIQYLVSKHGYHPGTAAAYVEAKGFCMYCEELVLDTRTGYSSGAIDHLIPRADFPDLAMETANWVYSCGSCNTMKSAYNPLLPHEAASDMILHSKAALIGRVRDHLRAKILGRNAEFEDIRRLILDPETSQQ